LDESEGYLAVARLDNTRAHEDGSSDALTRAESIFTLARDRDAFSDDLTAPALSGASPTIDAAKRVLDSMSAEQNTRHLHLSLTKSRILKKSDVLTPVATRLRLLKTILTGRF